MMSNGVGMSLQGGGGGGRGGEWGGGSRSRQSRSCYPDTGQLLPAWCTHCWLSSTSSPVNYLHLPWFLYIFSTLFHILFPWHCALNNFLYSRIFVSFALFLISFVVLSVYIIYIVSIFLLCCINILTNITFYRHTFYLYLFIFYTVTIPFCVVIFHSLLIIIFILF